MRSSGMVQDIAALAALAMCLGASAAVRAAELSDKEPINGEPTADDYLRFTSRSETVTRARPAHAHAPMPPFLFFFFSPAPARASARACTRPVFRSTPYTSNTIASPPAIVRL